MNHLNNAKLELRAAFDLGEIPPHDTLDRALWRARFVLGTHLYDEFDIEPVQAMGDLVADLMHLARQEGVDFDEVVDQAERTFYADREDPEWIEHAAALRAADEADAETRHENDVQRSIEEHERSLAESSSEQSGEW